MNKQTIITIILIIIILVGGLFILNDKVIKPYYEQQGYNEGYAYVINRIDTTATIPLIDRNDNNTIKWIPVKQDSGVSGD